MQIEGMDALIHVAILLLTGGAIYGGIRSDLKTMHSHIERLNTNIKEVNVRAHKIHKKTKHAHRRIDDIERKEISG